MSRSWRRCVQAAMMAGIVLGFASPASAQKPRDFPVSEKPVPGDAYPDRVTSFPGGVTSLADVTYSTLPGFRPLAIDIYMPKKGGAPKPLVLYIHGGGWMGGHTRQSAAFSNFPAVLAKLASEGFVVASLEYRLSGEAPFPAQLQDARAAIRFLKTNATTYGLDPSRVGVWGGSAGGHLAALAALSCGVTSLDLAPAAPGSECVQAAATWYGVFDFAPMLARQTGAPGNAALNPAENALLRCTPATCTAEAVRAVSPASYIDAKDPPFLLIHGEKDAVVPVAQSRDAEAAMKAAGMSVASLYIPGVDHSWIGASPAETRAATLKAVNATFDFFHKTLDRAK
jgi:acetyl esterase/lipase